MEDIEADCEGYKSTDNDCLRPFNSDFSSKKHNYDERVDSGLGSLGYISADHSLTSIEAKEKAGDDSAIVSSNSLESSLSKLNISNSGGGGGKDPEQFDSCFDSSELQTDFALENASTNEAWVSPHFSAEQIVDMFIDDEDGDTDLHMSIIHEIPEVAMQIIGLVPESDWLNHTNNLLQTPLHLAVLTKQVILVRRLMCAGASVDVPDQNGNTPLHKACRLGYDDVIRTLLRPVESKETFQNKYNIPNQKLPQDLESRNYEGLTCLHLAAIGGHINTMQLLLSAGANVNAVEGKSGRTVLHFAVDWGNADMVRFLLSQKGIEINARTYAGLTPIILAQGRQNSEIVSELLNRGAFYETWFLSEEEEENNWEEELSSTDRQFVLSAHRVYQHSSR